MLKCHMTSLGCIFDPTIGVELIILQFYFAMSLQSYRRDGGCTETTLNRLTLYFFISYSRKQRTTSKQALSSSFSTDLLYTILRSLHSRKLHILGLRARTVCTSSRVIFFFSLSDRGTYHFCRRSFPCLLNNSMNCIWWEKRRKWDVPRPNVFCPTVNKSLTYVNNKPLRIGTESC